MESRIGGRYATVDRRLQQHLFDLVARDTIAGGGAQMQRNSSPRLSATIIASVIKLRVCRGSPGRVHTSPHA
jgi:hypothetical protein